MALTRSRCLRRVSAFLIAYTLVFALVLTAITVLYPEPFRRASPFSDDFYRVDFWNLSHVEDDLRFRLVKVERVNGVVVEEGFFLSEVYGGVEIWIHCGIIHPVNVSGKLPALVFMHGYGGRWEDFKQFLIAIARKGFVVVALSAPGASGESTEFPSDTPENIFNVSEGPQYSYFYHVAYALMRGVTLARNLSYVDSNKVGVCGVSMGGIVSTIVAAVDDRVSYAIVIVAAGNYLDSVLSGSMANGLSPDIGVGDELTLKFLRYFDIYAYAAKVNKPVLYITATNDEFFTVVSYNDTLTRFPNATHVLYPNSNHFGDGWSNRAVKTVLSWLEARVKRERNYPKILSVKLESEPYCIKLSAVVDGLSSEYKVRVYYRPRVPAARWKSVDMLCNGYVCTATVPVEFPAALYVAVEDVDGIVYSASGVYTSDVITPMQLMSVTITAAVVALLVLGFVKCGFDDIIRALVVVASTYPFTARAMLAVERGFSLSIFEIMERYAILFGFSETTVYVLTAAIALAATIALVSRRSVAAFTYSVASLLYTTYTPHLIAGVAGSIIALVPDPTSFVAAVLGTMLSLFCIARSSVTKIC